MTTKEGIKESYDVEFFESCADMKRFLDNPPKYVVRIKKVHWRGNEIEIIVNKEAQEKEFRTCQKCGQVTLEFVDEENMMGHFSGVHCTNEKCNFDEIESSKPRWLVEEERDSLVHAGKARILPCGTFERADEFGGY